MLKILLFSSMTLLLYSCDGQLSRSKAEELIVERLHTPYPKTLSVHKVYTEHSDGLELDSHRLGGWGEAPVEVFANKGMLSLIDKVSDDKSWRGKEVEPTEEGKKYIVGFDAQKNEYAVRLCDMAFGEITGVVMSPDNKQARVEYTLVRENLTPFGECFNNAGRTTRYLKKKRVSQSSRNMTTGGG